MAGTAESLQGVENAGAGAPDLGLPDPEEVLRSGRRWLSEYLDRAGKARVVLGLSGGLDSTVTALWAARAVGDDRLTLLSLPCRTRMPGFDLGEEPVNRARTVARMIPDADFRVLDIGPVVASEAWTCGLTAILDASRWKGASGMVFGNLQARIRAVRLRTFANAEKGLVLGTGNLSERLLGYFTLGGDEQADVELLGGLFKTEIRQLAPLLDTPEEILDAEPSADLLPGQTDRKELGFTYREADRVLVRLLSALEGRVADVPDGVRERLETEGIGGVRPNVVRRVLDRVSETAFKRRRMPRFEPPGRDPFGGDPA